METPTLTNQTNPASSPLQEKASQSSVTNSSFENKSHAERAAILDNLYTEKPEFASGTIKGETDEPENHIVDRKIVSKTKIETEPAKQASEDYLQIMRIHYMKLILQSVRRVQPYAETPSASVYIHKILHTIRNFEENSPNEPILEVLFAFYDALAYQNQWATYTSLQFEKAEEILNRVTKESIKSKDIEKAIVAFDNIGFEVIPFQFSLEDEDL